MPDLGSTFHLPRLVGTARAKGLALLGDALTAADAGELGTHLGLRRRRGAACSKRESIARRLAAGPTQAFQRIKAVFNVEPPRNADRTAGARGGRTKAELGDTQGLCGRRAGVSRQAGAEVQRRVIFATGTLISAAAECGAAADSAPQLSQPPHAPCGLTIAAAASRRAARPSPRYAGARSQAARSREQSTPQASRTER